MKKFLLSVLLLCAGALVHAAGTWMLVTDSGKQIPIAQVGMLVAADDQPVFTVVTKDGGPEAVNGVTSVSFLYDAGTTGIASPSQESEKPSVTYVESSLLVMGCDGHDFAISNLAGGIVKSGTINSANDRISVADLAAGTYILSVGNSSFKFIKR
ncbi:MAG: T9SS type A sorting domain-containing protein [Muribaculaceae bacterium]|nr:T9SS type A sorting domain-containing protein [Muribaculaceae bacterium]